MKKQEFTMLAGRYKRDKSNVSGWMMSEKLDGMRFVWDGGISTGLSINDVPFANKHHEERFEDDLHVTGLWTRRAKPIYAHPDFLAQLPLGKPLDGELFMGRGRYQEVVSIARTRIPDERWNEIQGMIIDEPSYERLLADRVVKLDKDTDLVIEGALEWARARGVRPTVSLPQFFSTMLNNSDKRLIPRSFELIGNRVSRNLKYVDQTILPITGWAELIEHEMDRVLDLGGEGLIIRDPASRWCTERTNSILKVKPVLDDTGTVRGYATGRTDGRLEGMIGALVVEMKNGKIFELSGLNDPERSIEDPLVRAWAVAHPDERMPRELYDHAQFPLGSRVDFAYRELTVDGLPKEGRLLRRRIGD